MCHAVNQQDRNKKFRTNRKQHDLLDCCHIPHTCTGESQSSLCVSMETGRLKWKLSVSSCWQEVEVTP